MLKKKRAGICIVQPGNNIVACVTKSGSDKDAEVLLHDNARPQMANTITALLHIFKWEVLGHPLYSPDLSPSDYAIFCPLKKALRGKRFTSDDDVKQNVRNWFTTQPFTALCLSGTSVSTARANTSDILVLVSVPRPPALFFSNAPHT